MTCEELRACLEVYLDRELGVARSLDAQEHLTFCMSCQWAYAKEREFRSLLKTRLLRPPAPPGLRARIRAGLDAQTRPWSRALLTGWRRWSALPVAALVLLALAVGLPPLMAPAPPPPVSELVAQHQVYSRMDVPAEIVSTDQAAVAGWLEKRVRFAVPVPDFSPAGIRLIGARLSALSDREMAYLLYEKDRQLVSLFAFPRRGVTLPSGGWIDVGDSSFYVMKVRGVEVVLWVQGDLAYAVVSSMSRETLLECALTVRRLARTPSRSGA